MLTERLKTALPLIAVILLAFFLPAPWDKLVFLLVCVAGLALAFQEAFAMLNLAHGTAFKWLCWLFGTLLLGNTAALGRYNSFCDPVGILIFTFFLLAAAGIVFKHGPSIQNVDAMLVSFGVFFLLAWTLSFIPRLYFYHAPGAPTGFSLGKRLLLFLIVTTKIADVGAYALGAATAKLPGGNHKLSRLVSPKKSWEGLLGGMLFAAVAGGVLYFCGLPGAWRGRVQDVGYPVLPFWGCILMGAVAAVVGLLGDLLESCLKRAANFKDSGKIPGIGGILDVLDSIIPMAPLFYAVVFLSELHYHYYLEPLGV